LKNICVEKHQEYHNDSKDNAQVLNYIQYEKNYIGSTEQLSKRIDEQINEKEQELQVNHQAKS